MLRLLPIILILSSCSQFRLPRFSREKRPDLIGNWHLYEIKDYRHHLVFMGQAFLAGTDSKEVNLPNREKVFLQNLALQILEQNELFFNGTEQPRFHVVRSMIPFHFSLPGREVFLSTALIERFIKHEAILASIVSYELVRSEKTLYNKLITVPVGYMPLERILQVNRLTVDEKVEIHKWAYHSMRRAGFDGEYYLSWLQLVNRNTAEFMPLLGEAGSISREEAMFKAFMIRQAKVKDARALLRKDSSKDFYQFLFYLKDHG